MHVKIYPSRTWPPSDASLRGIGLFVYSTQARQYCLSFMKNLKQSMTMALFLLPSCTRTMFRLHDRSRMESWAWAICALKVLKKLVFCTMRPTRLVGHHDITKKYDFLQEDLSIGSWYKTRDFWVALLSSFGNDFSDSLESSNVSSGKKPIVSSIIISSFVHCSRLIRWPFKSHTLGNFATTCT